MLADICGVASLVIVLVIVVVNLHNLKERSMDFTLTRHAAQRAVDMALDPEQITAVVLHPLVRRWDATPGHNPGWLHTAGLGAEAVGAVVDELADGTLSVRTFLPGSVAAWRKDARFADADGRKKRIAFETP